MTADRRRRIMVRLALYIPAVVALVAWQWWGSQAIDETVGPDGEPTAELAWPDHLAYEHRAATAELWLRPIAELGQQQLAKLQPWIGINGWDQVGGELVWWHDGSSPRVAYLAASGEEAEHAGPTLFIAIQKGHAVLFGDPEFAQNFGEWSPSYALPQGWTVLTAPQSTVGATSE